MDISDEKDFNKFEEIRKSGKYNMVTDSLIISDIMGISKDRYVWIINNYKELNKLYGDR